MNKYAIFFDYDNETYRLPVNPEQIETASTQAIEKYEILKLGQIAIPTHMELKEYSFECEFPKKVFNYVETANDFKDGDYYLKLFENWRDKLVPVRFIASNGIGKDINTFVLIEECNVIEKAGEEGDKYISFKLLEFREFSKKTIKINTVVAKAAATAVVIKSANSPTIIPNANNSYTVVKGDTLWAIAKKYYGNGAQYTKIFNANKGIIKSPNLIYPGQKLVIPK